MELNTQAVDLQTAEQKLMARQIVETGQAVAQLRLNQRRRPASPSSDSDSVPSEEIESPQTEGFRGENFRGPVLHHVLPKMSCPRFSGENHVKRPLIREDLNVIQYQFQEADNTFITSDGTSTYNYTR